MISGLRGATIWSEDLSNLLPFYRDLLGLKVGSQTEGFVVLGDRGTPALALGTHSQVRGRNMDPARHMVGLSTDNIDADWKRLKAAGVEFIHAAPFAAGQANGESPRRESTIAPNCATPRPTITTPTL
jgi:catechol 2,3-dioxygenase-like lactoylglutathione lyase family enzyme